MSDAAATSDFTFLLCSERSGSNLITKLLDAHPDICGPSPSHVVRAFAPNLWRYGDLEESTSWSALCADMTSYLDAQLGVWHTSWTADELATSTPERSLRGLITAIYRREAGAAGKSLTLVKENQAGRLAPYLFKDFPESRFLFMVRDPRDMARSLKASRTNPGGVWAAASLWAQDQIDNLAVLGMLRRTDRLHLVRYEDLLADPEARLTEICTWLGVSYSPAMLSFHEQPLTAANAERIGAWENLSKPLLSDNAGRYRDELSEDEIRHIETTCRDQMAFFGYPPDFEAAPERARDVAAAVEALEAEVAARVEDVAASERELRSRRQAAIDRILTRNLDAARPGADTE